MIKLGHVATLVHHSVNMSFDEFKITCGSHVLAYRILQDFVGGVVWRGSRKTNRRQPSGRGAGARKNEATTTDENPAESS